MRWQAPELRPARDFVAIQLLNTVLSYMGRDTEKSFMRLLKLVRFLAVQERHKNMADKVAAAYRNNPAIRTMINNLVRNTHPNVRSRLAYNWFVRAMLQGIPQQRMMEEKLGVNVPNFILVDPTSACNLACEGCWAGRYSQKNSLSPERLDRLFSEAKELGIHWILFSGGEPLVYPHLFDLMGKTWPLWPIPTGH